MPSVSFLPDPTYHQLIEEEDENLDQEWEPAAANVHLPTLSEVQGQIKELEDSVNRKWEADRKHRGLDASQKRSSGRVIVVIHTLPYTCVLTNETAADHSSPSHAHHPVDIVTSDSPARPAPLHAHPSLLTSPVAAVSSGPTPVWKLLPRRGHSALHSGIASLASSEREVTLIAWPGDLQTAEGAGVPSNVELAGGREIPKSEGTGGQGLDIGELTEEEKGLLEKGLWELGAPNEQGKESVRCVPVWLRDRTWSDFYDGFCKKLVFNSSTKSWF
ncbi:glycosyltransferase family 20 protein [Atractiella rhizophila]|nr:glycosyltransferase family 20 protein [Atractiella rhizophila]